MELQPASIMQVHQARNGRVVVVTDDVGSVCQQLREIDPGLRVRYSEDGGFFAVYHQDEHKEYLVLTAQELDGRVVDRVREISSPGYDYAKALEDGERRRKADHEAKLREMVGEVGERLYHAIGVDTGRVKPVTVPREVT